MTASTLSPTTRGPRTAGVAPGTEVSDPARPAGRWATAGLLAWAVALLAVGCAPLASAWADWRALPVLAGTAAVAVLLTRLGLRVGASRIATSIVLIASLILGAYLLQAPSGTTFIQAVVDAIPRLLGQPMPLAFRPELLATPALLVGLTGVLVGLRLDAAARFAPVAGATVAYLAGLLLTTGAGDAHGLVAVLIFILALTGWVLLEPGRRPGRRRLAQAGPAAAAAVGLLAAASVLPLRNPYEPRDLVEPPVTVVELSSPLPRISAWMANPDVELLTVTGDAVPLRLAVLDQYDGSQWLAATEYSPIGTPGLDSLPPGRRQSRLRESIRISALGGSWLPAPGQVTSLSGAPALVDPGTGSVFTATVDPGLTYDVDAVLDDPDVTELKGATVPTNGPFRRYLQLPDLPLQIVTYAEQITANASTPFARAAAIEGALRNGPQLSSKAISGNALWRLQAFLIGKEGEPGARVGTSEQFATAFAVLARHSGLPTRVVVGFRPGKPLDDGSRLVRGRDALAWPEVYFADLGWVAFSPTPNDDTFITDRSDLGDDPINPAEIPDANSLPPPAEPHDTPSGSRVSWPLLLGGAALALLLLPPMVIGLLRLRRRSRHRRDGSTGAWAEVLDGLVLASDRGPGDESATQIGQRIHRDHGSAAATRIAEAAELQAFGPGRAAGAFPVADVREVRRLLRGGLPWWRRVWWWLDFRVLRRQPAAAGTSNRTTERVDA